MDELYELCLKRLKIDLGIMNSAIYDERLLSLLRTSHQSVANFTGAKIDLNKELDAELVIDWARWLWDSRREPRSMDDGLKYRLNCRAFARNIPEGEPND